MTSKKRFFRLALGAVLVAALLAISAVLLLPRILDSRWVRDAIHSEVSSRTGGQFTVGRVRLDILPVPKLEVFAPQLVKGDEVSIDARTVVLFPRILPLLKGNIEITRLRIDSPAVRYSPVPGETTADGNRTGDPFSPEELLSSFSSAIDRIRESVPDLSVTVTDGTLEWKSRQGVVLSVEKLGGRLRTGDPMLELTCRSNLWESLQLQWNAGTGRPPGQARITVSQFRPSTLANRLLPPNAPTVRTARLNLALKLDPVEDGLPVLSFSGDLPEATFEDGEAQTTVSAETFSGSLRADEKGLRLDVDRWKGTAPQLEISAGFEFTRSAGGGIGLRKVDLRAGGIDVAAVKEPVLFFGAGAGVLTGVFDVLREGRVKTLRLRSRIPAAPNAFSPEDFFLQGEIAGGGIHIPGIDLSLTSVAGKARIRGGRLTAEAVEAVHEDAVGTGGDLSLSLFDGKAHFSLDIRVETKLSRLPATLSGIIGSRSFSEKIETIRSIDGVAAGRLRLGDTLRDLRARIDLDRLSGTARVSFLPRPLEFAGNGLSYREFEISADSLDLSTGGASFTGISGRLGWQTGAVIDAKADSAEIRIDPVMAWLPEATSLSGRLSELTLSGGTLRLSKLALIGPLETPQRWAFDAVGRFEAVTVETDRLPGPVDVARLSFTASPGSLWIDAFRIGLLDADLSGKGSVTGLLAGDAGDGMLSPEEMRFSLKGRIGPEADRWLLSRLRAPENLALRVHRVSGAQLRWKRGGFFDLSGDLLLDQDVKASASVSIGPDRFDLKRLFIQDGDSRAEASFQQTDVLTTFSYNGRLTGETVDRLLKENRILKGRLMGGFRGKIDLDAPAESRIEGRLEIEELALPLGEGPQAHIERASLFGEGLRLDVERLDFTFDNSTHRLSGVIERGEDAFVLDMALSAERIDLNRLRSRFVGRTTEKSGTGRKPRLPVTGTVTLDVETALYDRHRFDDLSGKLVFHPDRTELTLERASLCGVAVPGRLVFRPETVSLTVRPAVSGGLLSETQACLMEEKGQMEGRFSFHGSLSGEGPADEIVSALNGGLTFSAQDGIVRKNAGFNILQRVLALVNVTEIFAGSMPDFGNSGLRFNAIRARADVEQGVMMIRELVIDGKNLTLTAEGSVALTDRRLDLTVLVAPLKTVDRIVGKIPLVGEILEGTLVSIPVKVRGTLEEPETIYASPSAVGDRLIGITERTLKLPMRVLRPRTSPPAP